MYLGEDVEPVSSIATIGESVKLRSESTAGGGWFGDALEKGSNALAKILPGVAAIISAGKKGFLYGPAAPGGGAWNQRHGYPDSYPGQGLPPPQTPTWLVPAAIGLGGVLLFTVLTGKKGRK